MNAATPLKILIVSNMYPTLEHPTNGIFVHEQVKALRAAGHDARVVSGKPLWLSGRYPRRAAGLVRQEMRGWSRPVTWDQHDGVPCFYFRYFAGALARPSNYPAIYRRSLAARLAQIRHLFPYQIVHTHTAYLDGRAGQFAARSANVPMILTEHTGPFSIVTKQRGMRAHTLAGLQGADRILAVSTALRDEIHRQLPTISLQSITVVPNGVDTTFFDPAVVEAPRETGLVRLRSMLASGEARETGALALDALLGLHEKLRQSKEGLTNRVFADHIEQALLSAWNRHGGGEDGDPSSDPGVQAETGRTATSGEAPIRVIWVGHHVDVKRVDRLLDAFAIASRREPRLRLTLVGSGPLENAMRDRAKALGVAEHTRFVRESSRAGVRRLMQTSDFLVISSETETFGVVGIEALAMGLPVIATDCGGPGDYLRNESCGLLVGNSMEDLAIGLVAMAARIALFDPGAIRTFVREHYDYSAVVARLGVIYAEALKAHRQPGKA